MMAVRRRVEVTASVASYVCLAVLLCSFFFPVFFVKLERNTRHERKASTELDKADKWDCRTRAGITKTLI